MPGRFHVPRAECHESETTNFVALGTGHLAPATCHKRRRILTDNREITTDNRH